MPVPPPTNSAAAEALELPDSVIVEMLKREVLLTKAKLHALTHEHILGERKLRTLKSQLRQVCTPTSMGEAAVTLEPFKVKTSIQM